MRYLRKNFLGKKVRTEILTLSLLSNHERKMKNEKYRVVIIDALLGAKHVALAQLMKKNQSVT